MKDTKISWCDHTANFWWGCFKVSDGCKNCYAETLSKRYGKDIWGPPATTKREPKISIWHDILKWDREAKAEGIRRRVFVSSMSDFLEDHPMVAEAREMAKETIQKLQWLDVLLLTKRPENAERFLAGWYAGNWPEHVWMGTTVENQKVAQDRIYYLKLIPAKTRFLSVEPMLENIFIGYPGYEGLHWVICGGESGPKARPFNWDWARDLRDQCKAANVAFWMKQGGGMRPPHELEDLPEDLRIRELPNGG
jgi:protein gp37